MCSYEENIIAADRPWQVGNVVRHTATKNLYTLLANGHYFSHETQTEIVLSDWSEEDYKYRSNFKVIA